MYIDKYQISEDEMKKVLNIYFKEERLIQIPKKEKKRVVILLYISRKFQKNTYYTEKEVNEILKDVFEDFVMIRRYLIDYKLLNRNKEGTKYWVVNT
ncbi:DUF2087 domain-containing protein [Priestia megaterium]|uniref:DUF2087 domain-containing protein n=1 Tax=Priestia megaterium TaxID=1404 RepID=UPI0020A1888A|nr:DUF2087 domain-containing protein [Priestia megaterium]MCP1452317.1 hypothetical protein [Priestia megaterium]